MAIIAGMPRLFINALTLITGGCIFFTSFCVILVVYRLFFHPLSKIPGPKLAAATQWYETYFEIMAGGGGMFTKKIKAMHEKYGPIVRINPHEVHIDDPDYYETIYAPSRPYDKLPAFENRFNMPHATFSTSDFDKHKPRRNAIAPFFAASRVRTHEPYVKNLVERISYRLQTEYAGRGRVVVMDDVFGCLTGDVITNLAFARSWHFIESLKWESPFTVAIKNLVDSTHLGAQFPWIISIMNAIPENWTAALVPPFKPVMEFRQEMEKQISEILNGKNLDVKESSHETVFVSIIKSDLPPEEKTVIRLQNEAMSVIGAGFETTRWALTVMTYHILANPEVERLLRLELLNAIPDPGILPTWGELQKLEYLSAVVEEGLRLSYGVVQRSPRISRHSALQYKAYVLPPGTPISSDTFHMHHNERVFPDSFKFKPERWLHDSKSRQGMKNLSRYNVAFGRGARMCLGMNMAYCEIYLTLAMMFRRFEFELFETTRESVDFHYDMLTPQPKRSTNGVRVLIK